MNDKIIDNELKYRKYGTRGVAKRLIQHEVKLSAVSVSLLVLYLLYCTV